MPNPQLSAAMANILLTLCPSLPCCPRAPTGGILFALFSLPFWFAGVQIGRQAVVGALMRERFAIGPNRFRVGQELALFNQEGSVDFASGAASQQHSLWIMECVWTSGVAVYMVWHTAGSTGSRICLTCAPCNGFGTHGAAPLPLQALSPFPSSPLPLAAHSLVPGGGKEKVSEGSTSQLTGARIVTTMFVNDEPQTVIELLEVRRRDMQEREGAGGGRAASWGQCNALRCADSA